MWGLDMIRHINEEAATKARGEGAVPYRMDSPDELGEWPPFPFPHIGYACEEVDETHERLDTLFVDSSGFGGEEEPALTLRAFKARLVALHREHGSLFLAIEEVGQFQVYVAIWKADGA